MQHVLLTCLHVGVFGCSRPPELHTPASMYGSACLMQVPHSLMCDDRISSAGALVPKGSLHAEQQLVGHSLVSAAAWCHFQCRGTALLKLHVLSSSICMWSPVCCLQQARQDHLELHTVLKQDVQHICEAQLCLCVDHIVSVCKVSCLGPFGCWWWEAAFMEPCRSPVSGGLQLCIHHIAYCMCNNCSGACGCPVRGASSTPALRQRGKIFTSCCTTQ